MIRKLWHAVRCRLGRHKSLDVIQNYGAAEHIGCPRCGQQMAIHHGMQAVIPWTPDVEQLYRDFGYDTAAATTKWQAWRRTFGFLKDAA